MLPAVRTIFITPEFTKSLSEFYPELARSLSPRTTPLTRNRGVFAYLLFCRGSGAVLPYSFFCFKADDKSSFIWRQIWSAPLRLGPPINRTSNLSPLKDMSLTCSKLTITSGCVSSRQDYQR